jgi:hypothetical protein
MQFHLLRTRCKAIARINHMSALLLLLLSSVCGAYGQIPEYVPTNGLRAWWPFYGNANDESGNNANCAKTDCYLTNDRFGVAGAAYYFNGTSSFMSVKLPKISTNQVSVSLWLKPGNQAKGEIGLVVFRDGPSTDVDGLFLFGVEKYLQFVSPCDQQFRLNELVRPVTTDTWHHIVGTYDGTTMRGYIDGELVSQQKIEVLTCPSSMVQIGCDAPSGRYFTGSLDDIAIWDRALSEAEVKALLRGDCQFVQSVITGPTSVCSGENVVYGVNPQNDRTYWWSTTSNGTIQGSATRDTVTVQWRSGSTTHDTIRLRETQVVTECVKTMSKIVAVAFLPAPEIYLPTVWLLGALPTEADSYQWLDENLQAITGANQQTYLPFRNGRYYVELTKGACRDTSEPFYFIIVSVDQDASHSRARHESTPLLTVNIQPNPAQHVIDVSWSLKGATSLGVYSADGRCVKSLAIAGEQSVRIPLVDLPRGVYTLVVSSRQELKASALIAID